MKTYKILTFLYIGLSMISCKKFIAIDDPIDKITSDKVFTNDKTAISALVGIYSRMSSISGSVPIISTGAMTIYPGLLSDELLYTGTITNTIEFADNSIGASNSVVSTDCWKWAYNFIYQANAVIEGVANSNGITPDTANQILGEAKFLRAFLYFYLANAFGDVPLEISSDYRSNSVKPRTATSTIYQQIKNDLLQSIDLLRSSYPSPGKGRVNKWAAAALLSRVYLYTGDWINAEKTASSIINSGNYAITANLNSVFLANSSEAIWQLVPLSTSINTVEGNLFIPASSATTLPSYILSTSFLSSFEIGDLRQTNWINKKTVNNQTYSYPYKYKVRTGTTITEYYMMLRYAELFLIRAEARANLNDLPGAIDDLNIIRHRAGLSNLVSGLGQPGILAAVAQERKAELFCEWGNRWFDLKRTGKSDIVLRPIKAGWQITDTLFPIPQSQILLNPSLTQNAGY